MHGYHIQSQKRRSFIHHQLGNSYNNPNIIQHLIKKNNQTDKKDNHISKARWKAPLSQSLY